LIKRSRLDDTFSGILQLEESPEQGQQLQKKVKKRRERNVRKEQTTKKLTDVGHSFVQNLKVSICAHARAHVIKRHASDKKGMLSCNKCISDKTGAWS